MKIKELLATEDKWTTKVCAKNAKGKTVPSASNEAICYCLMGAFMRCYSYPLDGERLKILKSLQKEVGDIGKWNDAPERTHKEILDLVTKLDI